EVELASALDPARGGEQPAADDAVEEARGVRPELLAVAERQLPDAIELERVHDPALAPAIRAQLLRVAVRETLRLLGLPQGVARVQRGAGGQPLAELRLEGVVARGTAVAADEPAALQIGVRAEEVDG